MSKASKMLEEIFFFISDSPLPSEAYSFLASKKKAIHNILIDEEREKLLNNLHHVGRTAHSVYRQLKADGIQGERGSFSCPIGEYLISKGHDGPEVTSLHVAVCSDYGEIVVDIPSAVAQFILNFDQGKYPDIERKE